MKKYLLLLFGLMLGLSMKAQIAFGNQDTLSTHAQRLTKVVAADIDGDGILDAISSDSLSNGTTGKIVWYKNNNDGNKKFADTSAILSGYTFATVEAGDIDGDGDNDIITIGDNDDVLRWYANDGTGTFTLGKSMKTYYSAISSKVHIQIADLDNDGDNDVIITNYYKTIFEWYENTAGDGSAWTEHTLSNSNIIDFVVKDMNGDGAPDIIAAENISGGSNVFRVRAFENNGDASSWSTYEFDSRGDPLSCIYVADLNNDNLYDIITGSSENTDKAQIVYYQNTGTSTVPDFQQIDTLYEVPGSSTPGALYEITDIQAADLDLDGDMDVLFSYSDKTGNPVDYVDVLMNQGGGGFETAKHICSGINEPVSIFAADLDSVPDIDLLVASRMDNTLAYYNNVTAIIIQDPQDASPVCVGDTAMFVVKAINAVSYKWRVDGVNYSTDKENDTLYVPAKFFTKTDSVSCSIIGRDPSYSKDTSAYAYLFVDVFETADAGSDKNICEATSRQLSGNNPTHNSGSWTSSLASVTFDNNTLYNATAQNLAQNTSIEMYWTIDNGACGLSTDTMLVNNYQNFIANAGTDDEICDSVYQLQADTVSGLSIGTWTCDRGEVSFDDAHNPHATASDLPRGISNKSTFQWEISNGACGSSHSSVMISAYDEIFADAGEDKTICDQTVGTIQANNPSPGNGAWTTSNTEVLIENSNYYTTNLSNIPHGDVTFVWTITNGVCPEHSDEMVMHSYNNVNIETQPFNLTVNEGEDALFGLLVTGDVKTYQWYKDDLAVNDDTRFSGSATDTLIISPAQTEDAGTYKCIIVDMCLENEHPSNEVQLTVNESTTGFDNLNADNIHIYPNPNSGVFSIDNAQGQMEYFKIINFKGETIYQVNQVNSKLISVDISSYPKGVYLLEISKSGKLIKSKIIIQ